MQTFVVNDQLTLTLYDSLKDLPAKLYAQASQYQVIACELGGSEEDRLRQLSHIELFVQTDQKDLYVEAMHNYRLARQLTLTGYQPKQLEWACFLHAINGERVADLFRGELMFLDREAFRNRIDSGIYRVFRRRDK